MNGLEQEFDIGPSRRADQKKWIVFNAAERARFVRIYPIVYLVIPIMRAGLLVCKTNKVWYFVS